MKNLSKDDGIRERLKSFLKSIPISEGKFQTLAGLSSGAVSNIGEGVSTKTLQKITFVYPQLNTTWLLTGDGQMLIEKEDTTKDEESTSLQVHEDDVPYSKPDKTLAAMIETNRMQAESNRNQSVANLKQTENNAVLVQLLEANLSVAAQNQAKGLCIGLHLKEKMAAAGVSENLWKSVDEGLAILDRLQFGDIQVKQE